MSPRARREYLEVPVLRYRKADRAGRSHLLDEFCATWLAPQARHPPAAGLQALYGAPAKAARAEAGVPRPPSSSR